MRGYTKKSTGGQAQLLVGSKFIEAPSLMENSPDQIPELVQGLFPKVGQIALIGQSDVGKSTLVKQLCLCVCTGIPFLDFEIVSPQKGAIYVSTEDYEFAVGSVLRKQVEGLVVRNHPGLENFRCLFFFDDLYNDLDKELTRNGAVIVVIDAFLDVFTGGLNESDKIRQFLASYTYLCRKHGCLILWVHHTTKEASKRSPNKRNASGGQGFEALMRDVVEMRKEEGQGIHFCNVKGNYHPDSEKGRSYNLVFDPIYRIYRRTEERTDLNKIGGKRPYNAKALPDYVPEITRKKLIETAFSRNGKLDTEAWYTKSEVGNNLIRAGRELKLEISVRGSGIWFGHYRSRGRIVADDEKKQHPKFRYNPS